MTAAGAPIGIVPLLQICYLSLSKGQPAVSGHPFVAAEQSDLQSPRTRPFLSRSIHVSHPFADGPRLKQALGLGIIAGAAFVKVPQITALTSSKSAEGLSALGFELENIGLTIHAAYGFLKQLPFGTYGEATIMLLQEHGAAGPGLQVCEGPHRPRLRCGSRQPAHHCRGVDRCDLYNQPKRLLILATCTK